MKQLEMDRAGIAGELYLVLRNGWAAGWTAGWFHTRSDSR